MKTTEIIPKQLEGKSNDLAVSFEAAGLQEAVSMFEIAANRLQHPGNWHALAGALSSAFCLMDDKQNILHRSAQEGDLLRIDVTGPGPQSGNGYDWVRIACLSEGIDNSKDSQWIAMRVEPCPASGSKTGEVAHFFKAGASSTFLIVRESRIIRASYHGRNEVVNTETSRTIDNVRNAVLGSAAMAGVSELQWNALLNGFLQTPLQ